MASPATKTDSHSSSIPHWSVIVAVWTGFGVLNGTQTIIVMRSEGMHHPWGTLFVTTVLCWMSWALFTPFIEWMGDRFPPVHFRPISTWIAHLAACILITVLTSSWAAWLRAIFDPFGSHGGRPSIYATAKMIGFNEFHIFILLYGAILAVRTYFRTQRRLAMGEAETARLNEELTRAQLESLRRQLEPHFLFNTLNAIAGLVREKRNDDAVGMIAALGDLLRHVLEGSPRPFVSLDEEMQFLSRYLDIQKMRFTDHFDFSLDIPPSLLTVRVPSLILQPMVENAVKHGIDKRRDGGILRISAVQQGQTVKISVYNNGPSLPDGWEQLPAGIGIANVRTRLGVLYGSGWSFTLKNHADSGVEALLTFPSEVQTA